MVANLMYKAVQKDLDRLIMEVDVDMLKIGVKMHNYRPDEDCDGLGVLTFDKRTCKAELIKSFTKKQMEDGTADTWLDFVTPDGSTRRDKTFQLPFCQTALGRVYFRSDDTINIGKYDFGVFSVVAYEKDVVILYVTDIANHTSKYACHTNKSSALLSHVRNLYSSICSDFLIVED